jgi:hypothetical protein
LLALAVVAGCGEGTQDDMGWTETAGQTSCAEWLDVMTTDQRRWLAQALLEVAWDRAGAGELPSGDLAVEFANGIGTIC